MNPSQQHYGSVSSIFVSDSDSEDGSEKQNINSSPRSDSTPTTSTSMSSTLHDQQSTLFLKKIGMSTPRYKHQVLFFNKYFDDEGVFEVYTDATDLPPIDRCTVKALYEENIFDEVHNQGVIRMADTKSVSFLMQPFVWATIESDKLLLFTAYEEICYRLMQLEGELVRSTQFHAKTLEDQEILFRYCIS